MNQITRVQRDILVIISGIGPTEGVKIGDELGEYYYSSVTDQQVYHALNDLTDVGHIEKRTRGRSNEYRITAEGERALSAHRDWRNQFRDRESTG